MSSSGKAVSLPKIKLSRKISANFSRCQGPISEAHQGKRHLIKYCCCLIKTENCPSAEQISSEKLGTFTSKIFSQ